MKAIYLKTAGAIALTATIAACIPSVDVPLLPPSETIPAAPAPTPTPSPTPTRAATSVPVVQEPVYANYLDAPQTPGTWIYRDQSNGGMALYSATNGAGSFMLECDRVSGNIMLFRSTDGRGSRSVTIKTETTTRTLQGSPMGPGHVVSFNPRDTLLDAMAITKGRFAVSVDGERTLYIPAWVEVTRVIEDCR